MLYPSISNALESRPRSVFDLKLSQSKGRFKITEQHAKAIFDNIAEQQEFDEIIEEKSSKRPED